MPRFLVLSSLLFLSPTFARDAFAQSERSPVMQMAMEMGRVLMGVNEFGVQGGAAGRGHAPSVRADVQESDYKVVDPLNRTDAKLRDGLVEARLPLVPEEIAGGQRLVLIGDMPYLSQGRAWIMQSAGNLALLGFTHAGFEMIRADRQADVDAYRQGTLPREKLLARLLGDNRVRFRESRRLAFEELISTIDTLHLAGLKVAALGLPEADEGQALKELAGMSAEEVRPVLDQLGADDLAGRIGDLLRDPGARMLVLASAGRVSRYSTAGRLAQAGLQARIYGFFFPESQDLNMSLDRASASIRYSQHWAYVPMDRKTAGLDALLIAPASLPQPPLH